MMKHGVQRIPLAQLAKFIIETRFDDFPRQVIEYSKLLLLDNLGAILLGARHAKSTLVTDIARQFSSGTEATVITKGLKCSSNVAAFANSSFCQIYDFNDGHRVATQYGGTPHPGRVVVPATLAEAELNAAPGKDLLAALIIGYDVAIKACTEKDRSTGPALAGAAIAARLRGYSQKRTLAALSIALSTSAPKRRFDTIPAYLRHGLAARGGIEAAVLAGCGMKRTKISDEILVANVFRGFGVEHGFEAANVYLKPYPTCRMTHGALEALLQIRKDHGVGFEDVEKIVVRHIRQGMYVAKHKPSAAPSFGAAPLNLYYCLASALVNGEMTARQFEPEALRDEHVHAVYDRIEVISDEALSSEYPHNGRPAIVSVHLKNGAILTSRVDISKGNPANPLNKDEVARKFHANAVESLPHERGEAISATVLDLEKMDDLSGLFAGLA